ncbi:MAG: SlyX family protein [Candidatus Accumulibacter sp.]|jgi:SlyX protein|nr:SlyX family protein [Candidatus Accumulibacter necessarius]
MEQRLVELESRISLAEDLMEEVNLTVYRQQQQIELLQRQLRQLQQQLQDVLAASREQSPREELPPHY